MSEEMEKSELQRNRFKYETGQNKFLLYNERLHFHKKVNLRLVKNVVFYSLPEDPEIFKDIVEQTNPSTYKEKLSKFSIEDKNSYSKNDSAVISLVSTSIEKYNLEKVIGQEKLKTINFTGSYIC